VNLAFGSFFVFLGCLGLAYAAHTHEATTFWAAYQSMLSNMRGVSADAGQA